MGESTGGESKFRLRSRAMAWGWRARRGSCSRDTGSTHTVGNVGVGGDSDDLELSGRQGGDRATLLAACLSKAQGPGSDAALVAEGEWALPGSADR